MQGNLNINVQKSEKEKRTTDYKREDNKEGQDEKRKET
jgi:hypothetical protein